MDVTLCKLPKGDGQSYFRVKAEWYNDSMFRITILDDDRVWTGKVLPEAINTMCQQLSSKLSTMTVQNWLKETKRALTSQGGSEDFKYLIENESFMWMKFDKNFPGIKIKFGVALLEPVPTFEMIECMMDQVIEINSNLQVKVNNLENCKRNLESENQYLLQRLSTYKSEKVQMEETLYSSFIDVLNAKKTRIELLQKQLDDCLLNTPSTSTHVKPGILSNESFDVESDDATIVKGKVSVRKKPLKALLSKTKAKPTSASSNQKSNLKALPKKRQQTNTTSDAMSNAQTSSKRKVGSVEVPETSGNKATGSHFDSQNHYNSDTDVDSGTDNEDGDRFNVIKSEQYPSVDDILFGNSDQMPSTTGTLPKRMKQGKPSAALCGVLETGAHDETSEARLRTQPLDAESKREAERDYNTQQLLDNLGI